MQLHSSANQPTTSTIAGSANFAGAAPTNTWDFGVHPDSPQTGSYCPDLERPSSATQPTTSTIAGSANFAGADLPPPACKQDWAVQRQAVGWGGGRENPVKMQSETPWPTNFALPPPARGKDLAVRCQAVGRGEGWAPTPLRNSTPCLPARRI